MGNYSKTTDSKTEASESKGVAYDLSSKSASSTPSFQFQDQRLSSGVQRQLQSIINLNTTGISGENIIQRYVMKRSSPKGWVYYSSHNPSKVFATEAEAQQEDEKWDVDMQWEEGTRFPTIYSYTHTSSSNQMSDKPQGPHTAPHILVDQAFGKLKHHEEFLMVFYEQVPSPEGVKKILIKEKGENYGNLSFELERFMYDYTSLYNSIETAIWTGNTELEIIQLQLRMMLERNPYGCYAWKSKAKASQKSLKFKGTENRNAKFRDAVDTRGRFNDQEAYGKFIDTRERLVEGKHNLTQEEIEYDGQLDGEYMSQEELVEAVIYGQEVVGNTINLYPTGEWVIQRIEIVYNHLDVPVNAKIRLKRRGG